MKNISLNLLLIFSFCILSCNQDENLSSISEKITILEQDPITNEYFKALALLAKTTRELDKDIFESYKKMIGQQNNNPCNIDKEILNGDVDIEKYAKIACRTSELKKVFNSKYPFIRNMKEEERKELLTPFVEKFFTMKPINRNHQN